MSIEVLREYIQAIAKMGESSRSIGAQERFVLKHGHEFTRVVALPEHLERGEMKRCFANAGLLAFYYPDEFAYTEGYALQDNIPIPLMHGWLTNRNGEVVDPTWNMDDSVVYLGVLIKHDYISSRLGLSMIDDWHNRWPLLSNPNPEQHLIDLNAWVKTPAPERIGLLKT